MSWTTLGTLCKILSTSMKLQPNRTIFSGDLTNSSTLNFLKRFKKLQVYASVVFLIIICSLYFLYLNLHSSAQYCFVNYCAIKFARFNALV